MDGCGDIFASAWHTLSVIWLGREEENDSALPSRHGAALASPCGAGAGAGDPRRCSRACTGRAGRSGLLEGVFAIVAKDKNARIEADQNRIGRDVSSAASGRGTGQEWSDLRVRQGQDPRGAAVVRRRRGCWKLLVDLVSLQRDQRSGEEDNNHSTVYLFPLLLFCRRYHRHHHHRRCRCSGIAAGDSARARRQRDQRARQGVITES